MDSGMLWFDNDPKTDLAAKIQKAADYYRRKYGSSPDTCLVNPKMYDSKTAHESRITIRSYHPILPGYLWIGISDKH